MRRAKWWLAEFRTWFPSLAIALVIFGLVYMPMVAAVVAKNVTVTGTWSYDYTPVAACNSSVTRNCISGFTFGEWNGSSCSNLQVVANPSTPIGVVNGISAKVKINGNPSKLKFCVVSNYVDITGATQHSGAAIVNG